MSLYDILFILFLVVIIAQFWRVRSIAESASRYLKNYCDEQHLQLISIARYKTKIGIHRGKPDWVTQFIFEFSGNGTDRYTGTVSMKGTDVVAVETPPYRMS